MKKLFLLIPAMLLTMMAYATTPGLNKTTPVTLMAADATLSANGSIVTDSITWPESTIHEGFAKWRVNIADMGYYSVTLDMRSNNTFFFRISVVDPATGDTLRQSRSPKNESDKVYAAADCGTLNLRGLEAGEYDIVVTDTIQWSHGKVASMTLTYAGGLTINIPANPLNGADAVLGKTGEKYMLRTAEGYLKSNDNSVPTSEYAYWYVHATQGGNMKVTANVEIDQERAAQQQSQSSHEYHVELYSDLNASALSTTAEAAETNHTGPQVLTPELVIPDAGDYFIKLVNYRQYSSSILSSISFEYKGGKPIEIPQTLTPDDAILSPRAWVDDTGEVDSILFTPRGSEGYNSEEWVKWRVKVTTKSYYNFTAYVCRPNGSQKYEIKVLSEDESVEKISNTNESMAKGDQTISSGKVELTPGVYVVKVRNIYDYAESRLLKVVATYEGGKAINIPQTLTPDDVILSSRAWVDKTGAVDSILFTPRGSEGYNDQEWAKWKVNVTDQAYYNFTAHVCRPNGGQKYEIKVLSEDESVEKISNTNESMAKGDQTISSGKVELTPGVYVIKVRNTYNNAESRLLKVVATYEGGKAIDIPETLIPDDAMLSSRAWVDKTGAVDSILFTPRGSEGYNDQEWAKWKVNVTDQAYYNFTAHVCRPNGGQKYEIKVLSEDESVEKISYTNESMSSGNQTISSGKVELTPGVYVIKVRNTYNNAESRLLKVVATYEGGKTQALPGILYGADAVLEKIDPSTKMMIRLENGDIQSSNNVNHLYEYAYWKVHAKEGEMTVMLNIPEESTSQHQYQVALYNNINDAEPVVPAVTESKTGSTGVFTIASTLNIAAEGDYYIKLVNTVQYSSSTIRSISIAPIVTIDENETNMETVIGANDGKKVNVQLNRTLTANMYNTICLPFAVSAVEKERVFGDAVVKELTSSSIEEGDFVLNLNFEAVDEMAAGTPYIVKPMAAIANPKFIGVTIDKTLNPVNTTNANFVGNFVAGTIPASENNLFLGANNTLYFPIVDMDILGMRAYFVIHDAPAGAVKRARIIEREQIITDVELVAEQPNAKSQKILRDGQLIIIRDGNMYNVMGAKLQ